MPGSPEAVALLREAGLPLAFVTNSAYRTPAEVAAKLASHGISGATEEVVTSAMATATLVEPGERVLVIGSSGLLEALRLTGAEVVAASAAPGQASPGRFDAVAVGITFSFDYAALDAAMRAIADGARFIAANLDPTFPVAGGGVLPGNGSLVAAIATASGTAPQVAGKPSAPIAELVRGRLGDDGIVVGDRCDTDGEFAAALGYRFGLVFSGVTSPADIAGAVGLSGDVDGTGDAGSAGVGGFAKGSSGLSGASGLDGAADSVDLWACADDLLALVKSALGDHGDAARGGAAGRQAG